MSNKTINKRELMKVIYVDLLMIFALLVNLLWIIFDWLYAYQLIHNTIIDHLPGFYKFYEPVHQDFWKYDLIFVAIFVTEIIIRWIIAIRKRTYHSWFFYPFVHWYDVLGSIPVGGLRWLRILRIISIIFRLQKLQLIDITRNYVFQQLNKYFDILMEEVSDRVVVNVLNGVQDEIKQGTPIFERIVHDVVLPRKEELVGIIAGNLQIVLSKHYDLRKDEINEYVNKVVKSAVEQNEDIRLMERVPVFGDIMAKTLKNAVADIVHTVVVQLVEDVSSDKSKDYLVETTAAIMESLLDQFDTEMGNAINDVTIESLELVKEQVKVQQWKLKDLEQKEAKLHEKIKKASKNDKKTIKLHIKLEKLKQKENQAIIKPKLFKVEKPYDFLDS